MGKDQLTGYVFLKICNLACYSSVIQINGFLSIQILETLFCSYKHAAHRNGNHFMLDLPLSNVNAASINCRSQKTWLLDAASLFWVVFCCTVVLSIFPFVVDYSQLNWVDTLTFIKEGMFCKDYCIRSTVRCICSSAYVVINDAERLVDGFWVMMSQLDLRACCHGRLTSLLLVKWKNEDREKADWAFLLLRDERWRFLLGVGLWAVVCTSLILQDIYPCAKFVWSWIWSLPCLIDGERHFSCMWRSSCGVLGRSFDTYVQFR